MKIEDFGKVLFEFPVLYAGWDMDEKGYVVQAADGMKMLILSNHGRLHMADPSEIQDKTTEYRAAIDASRHALSLLSSTEINGEWWRDKATEMCLFHVPVGDGSHVLTLNGREINGRWEYAILQWWHQSPSLWLSWTHSQMLQSHPDMRAQTR